MLNLGEVTLLFAPAFVPSSVVWMAVRSVCSGPVAQWTTRLTTNQKIAGSNPARVDFYLFFLADLRTTANPIIRTMIPTSVPFIPTNLYSTLICTVGVTFIVKQRLHTYFTHCLPCPGSCGVS